VVTVSLNSTGTTAAAAFGVAAPSGFLTVTAGGCAYSTSKARLLTTTAPYTLPSLVFLTSILDASNSNPLISKVRPSAYPRPLFCTTK